MNKQLLSDAVQSEIDRWLDRFPKDQKRSAIIPALFAAQKDNGGWLTEELVGAVASYIDIPKVQAMEVATFYTMYDLEPVGKNKISICTNISCMLRGSEKITSYIQEKLGVGFNCTTKDGKFTLKEVECLGACAGAPAAQINESYHENLTEEKIDKLLEELG